MTKIVIITGDSKNRLESSFIREKMKKALITGTPLPSDFIQKLVTYGYEITNGSSEALIKLGVPTEDSHRELTQEEIKKLIPDCELYIYGGLEAADSDVIELALNLKLIVFLGTGWSDSGCVDPASAKKAGITVTNTPHAAVSSMKCNTLS